MYAAAKRFKSSTFPPYFHWMVLVWNVVDLRLLQGLLVDFSILHRTSTQVEQEVTNYGGCTLSESYEDSLSGPLASVTARQCDFGGRITKELSSRGGQPSPVFMWSTGWKLESLVERWSTDWGGAIQHQRCQSERDTWPLYCRSEPRYDDLIRQERLFVTEFLGESS